MDNSEDEDDDPDDSEMDDEDAGDGKKDVVPPSYELGEDRVPVGPQTDAKFLRKWDAAMGRTPKKAKGSGK